MRCRINDLTCKLKNSESSLRHLKGKEHQHSVQHRSRHRSVMKQQPNHLSSPSSSTSHLISCNDFRNQLQELQDKMCTILQLMAHYDCEDCEIMSKAKANDMQDDEEEKKEHQSALHASEPTVKKLSKHRNSKSCHCCSRLSHLLNDVSVTAKNISDLLIPNVII